MWATKVQPISTTKASESPADDGSDHEKENNFRSDIKEFGENVTLHGVRYFTDSEKHLLRRLLWLLGLIVVFVILGYNISRSSLKWFDRPISTVITMNYVSNITFPAITICNYNMFKSSLVSPAQALLVSNVFNINPKERIPVNWTAYAIQSGGPMDVGAFVYNTAHRIEDMLLQCKWRSVEECSAANFSTKITDWGVCYTFNNDPKNALQVKRPGSTNGLNMVFSIEHDEYTYGENTGAGLKVLLHPPGQPPLVKELGFSVAPGFETSVSVRYNSITNLKHPYQSNCTDKSLIYSKQYTVPLCRYECKIEYVKKMCGCKDVRYHGDKVRICSPPEQIDCIYAAEANFTASDIDCDCNVPCSSFIYEGRISMAHWPAPHVAAEIMRRTNSTEDFARKNLLNLKIYFEQLSFQEIRQVPAYDFGSLQSDVGGYMGLLCGMSIITIGEFIDFIAVTLVKRCVRNKTSS